MYYGAPLYLFIKIMDLKEKVGIKGRVKVML